MADDQVKYSDLIVDDGAIDALDKRLDDIKHKMAEVKDEAATLTAETRNLSTATREQQQATTAHAAAAENLRQKMKGLTDEQKQLEAERRKYAKLTEQEANRVKAMAGVYQQYAAAVREGTDAQMKALPSVDIQNKSYNELYQTYNALKDALNKMTVAERENTAAGKSMVNQAKEIRDMLNNLQQATGNYALNVGNYMSALSGLQFQTQQLLREIPSAQNLTQFFLAISNNIPMFADALARYNKGLPEIKVKLAAVSAEIARQEALMAGMNTETAAYAAKQEYVNALKKQEIALQGASVSGWRAILKAVGSWQTLLIAGLLLLRKIPDIIKWISSKWNEWLHGVQLVKNEMNTLTAKAQVYSDVLKKTNDEIVKLDMVVERLKQVDKGTKEWKDGVAMVNDITKQNLDAVKTTKEEIEKVTEAYKEQAIQIATNDIIAEKIAKSRAQKALVKAAMEADTLEAAMELAGIKPDSKEGKKFIKAWNDYNATRPRNYTPPTEDWLQLPTIQSDLQVPSSPVVIEEPEIGSDERNKVENIVRSQFQDMIDEESEKILQQMIKPVKPLKKEITKKERQRQPSGSFNDSYDDVTMADLLVQEANAMSDKGDTVLQTIQLWYNKRVAITNAAYEKEKETLAKEREERNKSLTDNLLKAEQFKSKYDALVAEVDKDPYLDDKGKAARKAELKNQLDEATKLIESESVQRGNIKKYYDEREIIAEQKKQNELSDIEKQRTEKLFKEEERRFKARQDADKRRFALEKHNSIEQAKFNMEQEIASKQWQIDHANELELSKEQLAILKEEVEWLQKKYNSGNYNAKRGNTGNYSNIMDVLFGEKITNEQISALNSVFDQAKAALNSWMDARKAAADQAKELADDEVSAAENALNREIELRNQGYANDVALREKELADAKEQQKKALEMQQKAKEEELAINTAMEASNMAVAIANLFKQFGYWAIPMAAVMLGAWGSAKISALNQIRSTKYREGGVMLLEGGSHESGHDVNLGIGPDGSNLRAEGGEYFAVINKRNSRKYGSEIPAVVNALNSGMFEDRYIKTSDAVGLLPRIIRADNGSEVDLSAVESGVGQLVKQGETSYNVVGDYMEIRYKNLTRRVRIGG